ncbi:MAG: 1-hydroxycarotenoid 3,4-desaturase CrtD [Hyphomicrobium sp.]
MGTPRICVIGAGMGGLVAALELSRRGFEVQVFERQGGPGGKVRQISVNGQPVDAGPTVFTMRWVFEQIFSDAGSSFEECVPLQPLRVLARHAWSDQSRLDLFADIEESADAIGRFSGSHDAKGYRIFCERARSIYETLEGPFIRSPQPSPMTLALGSGVRGIGEMWKISPFSTLMSSLSEHFEDRRLRQLFGRYATYCGSSPYQAPATLMLVAHVEQDGVWIIKGGMHQLALSLMDLAKKQGAIFRFDAEAKEILFDNSEIKGVQLKSEEVIECDAVIINADSAAVAQGLFGKPVARCVSPISVEQRSLSALTWVCNTKAQGFPLARHNVFFSSNYEAEFEDIFKMKKLPSEPTIYVCAQDRTDGERQEEFEKERLLLLVNAPAIGDRQDFTGSEVKECEQTTFSFLKQLGLSIDRREGSYMRTTPADFNQLFPATGGALYGAASHGWMASFSRPSGKTRIPRLYLAGGSVHPGPGVPMAALSGWLAAAQLAEDLTSIKWSRGTDMRGGTSTP